MKTTTLLIAGSLLLFSCKKDDESPKDTVAPVVSSIKINNNEVLASTSEVEVFQGKSFDLQISVSDNVELSQLQLEIHEALDEHNHARVKSDGDTLSYGPTIKTLSGTSDFKNFTIFTATDTNFVVGTYHIEAIILDAAGNRTEKIVEFHLEK